MMRPEVVPGSFVVNSRGGLCRVVKVGKNNGAPGAWIIDPTGDPGASATPYPVFSPDWCLRPAIVGKTVCPHPRGEHWCGLAHVSAADLTWLPRAEVAG